MQGGGILRQIEKDIADKSFKKTYLIYGEEDYLVKKYTELLKSNIVDETNAMMNMDLFEGNDCNINKIINAGDTAPFFNDYRLIVVSNSGLFKDGRKADTSDMADAIRNLPDGCVYLFTNEKVDKRNALYKAVKKIGYCCEINYRDIKELTEWVKKKSGNRLDSNCANYFVKNIGNSMKHLAVELDKLLAYAGDKKISTADIDIACTKSLETYIFDMVGAMGNKNAEKALEIYNNMIFEGEEPIGILSMIARQFRLMLQCKYLQSKKNFNALQISAELKQNKFVVSNCLTQSVNFKISTLMKALEDCANCDSNIKSGLIGPKLGVEIILLKYSK